MGKELNISDEFICESFVKASRFHVTLILSTAGVIVALLRLPEPPIAIAITTPIAISFICFLAALILSVVGQLFGTVQIMEKRKIKQSSSEYILGGFWLSYVPGVMATVYYLLDMARQ